MSVVSSVLASLNCTSLELKLIDKKILDQIAQTLNCTSLELKLKEGGKDFFLFFFELYQFGIEMLLVFLLTLSFCNFELYQFGIEI